MFDNVEKRNELSL